MKKISELILTDPVEIPPRPVNTFTSFTEPWYKVEAEIKEWNDKYDDEGYLVVFRDRLALSASFINYGVTNADSSVWVKTLKEVRDMFQKYNELNMQVDFVYIKLTDLETILFGDKELEAPQDNKKINSFIKEYNDLVNNDIENSIQKTTQDIKSKFNKLIDKIK
jgi:hypothetical protein